VRASVAANTSCLTLQVDFHNVFNSVSHHAMLAAVAHLVPALLRYTTWLSASPADTVPILAMSGVRQGDPPGSLLVASILQVPLK
jgi:hypothetical protein